MERTLRAEGAAPLPYRIARAHTNGTTGATTILWSALFAHRGGQPDRIAQRESTFYGARSSHRWEGTPTVLYSEGAHEWNDGCNSHATERVLRTEGRVPLQWQTFKRTKERTQKMPQCVPVSLACSPQLRCWM